MNFEERIFSITSDQDFESVALDLFKFQFERNPLYREFAQNIGLTYPKKIEEIPFLPISFFKSHQVILKDLSSEVLFKSSGTGGDRSTHHVHDTHLYIRSFTRTFESHFGELSNSVILALLPSYLEQGESSLVFMVDHLIAQTNDPLSGFYLDEHEELLQRITIARRSGKKIILIGVSYALMDLATMNPNLEDVVLIETGGMKGRRKELTKEALHKKLMHDFNLQHIYSEYGMTELLSQAYCDESRIFKTPPWLKILIRDVNDPLSIISDNRTGGINVIDLANMYSCPFIATQDLGKSSGDGFEILGRYDQSDIRGCNLLVQ